MKKTARPRGRKLELSRVTLRTITGGGDLAAGSPDAQAAPESYTNGAGACCCINTHWPYNKRIRWDA